MFVRFHTKDNQVILEEIKRLHLMENRITFCDTSNVIHFKSTDEAKYELNCICGAIEAGARLYSLTHEVTL